MMSLKMKCEYLHKMCKGGCKEDWYVCRAFFPERQPRIMPSQLSVCQSHEHMECPQLAAGRAFREERKRKNLEIKCPFASNTVCGKPWLWMCKGRVPPFFLTLYEEDDKGLPIRDEDGGIKFTRGIDDIKDTCLSGDPAIYKECPWYKEGTEFRDTWRRVKKIQSTI